MATSHQGARVLRCVAAAAALALLAGCFGKSGGPDASGSDGPSRTVNLPPVPRVDISDQARQEYAQALRYFDAGNLTAAEQAMRTLATRYPELSGPKVNLAVILAEQGNNAEGLDFARAAVTANPRSAPAYNTLGLLERRAGNFAAAETAYKNALEAKPDYHDARLNMGILYDLYMGRPSDALGAYKQFQSAQTEPDEAVAGWIADLARRVDQ